MKQLLAILVMAVVVAGCSGKEDPVASVQTSDVLLSPAFADGTQFYSVDGGQTWHKYTLYFSKLAGCACSCSYTGTGHYPGTCEYPGGQDVSCDEYCKYGGRR